jgi:hypothetical protein
MGPAFCYCWKHQWNLHFEIKWRWSATVAAYHGHPGNDAIRAATSFSETRRNHKGTNQLSKDGGGTTPMFFVAKHSCTDIAVCQHIVLVNQPFLVPSSFWMSFSRFSPSDIAKFPVSNDG